MMPAIRMPLAKAMGATLRRLRRDKRGLAATEFALVVSFVPLAMLNVFELARYFYQAMQVQNATQMAGQAAWAACDTKKLPAKTNCPNLTTAIANGLKSTELGTVVTLKSGFPTEGYYCLNASNTLQMVSSYETKVTNCSAVGKPSEKPGDYIRVEASYAFAPLFPGISVGSLLGTPINASAMVRLQ